jgi:hypothetical protein
VRLRRMPLSQLAARLKDSKWDPPGSVMSGTIQSASWKLASVAAQAVRVPISGTHTLPFTG